MADVNAPVEQAHVVAPPIRTDEQILPRIRWVPIGKSNCYLDAEKSQSNPIYKIAVDILKQTNFFRAFTASSTIPAIYIQQFWDTICYDRTNGGYKCQLDEQWFNLTKDTLRDALQITPVNNNKVFSSPLTQDTLINFVNDLGVSNKSNTYPNIILWGIINRAHIDYAERMWEEFNQSIHTFTEDKKNLAEHTQRKKKATLIMIPMPTEPKGKSLGCLFRMSSSLMTFEEQITTILTDEKVANIKDNLAGKTDTGKFQPLPEVQGMGKEKVGAEQAAQVLLNLQTPKKMSQAEQYIFQRRTSAPTEPSGHDESSSLYVELGLTESDTESDEEVPPVVKSGAPDEGQAGPNPSIQDEGQAGPNPGNDTVSQTLSTPGVHARPNLEHTDSEATDATSQPQPGQMDEEFTATAYPNIQENLKLTVDDLVIPEKPDSSTGTLSSLQHLAKDFSFSDQFFNDKPPEANNEKATVDTEAELMMSVTIHQDTSAIPPMTSPVIDLVYVPDSPTMHRPLPTTTTATATTTTTIMTTIPLPPQPQQVSSDSILINRLGELEQHIADLVDANQALEERLDKHGSRLYRLENQDIPNQVSKAVDEIVKDVVDWAMHAPLREHFRDLPEANMKEILHNRMWESKSYQTHKDHMTLYEALEKSMARDNRNQLLSDLAEVRKKKKKRQGSPKTPSGSPPHPPPPPPPPASPSGTSGASALLGHLNHHLLLHLYPTLMVPSISSIPEELHIGDDTTVDEQAYSSSGKYIGRDHIPTVNLRKSWWKPITEDRPATPEPAWSIPSSDLTVPTNNWASALKSTYTPPPENSLLAQISDMATFMDW
ncbi:hypothetical protein Tco_0383461 [Tanacetum coccineum]